MRGYARNRSGSGSSSENYSSDSSEEQVVGNWLYEDEPAAPAPAPKAAVPAAPRAPLPNHPTLLANLDLFYSLCEVEDLDFASKPEEKQVQLVSTITVVEYSAGQNVFEAGDTSTEFYIIIDRAPEAASAPQAQTPQRGPGDGYRTTPAPHPARVSVIGRTASQGEVSVCMAGGGRGLWS